ncbi:(S)-benzoin forming benzil reductase [Halalkalibacter akibai]|uniref:Oxidoreductase n=1 Tax=Halalkalibacter akibai (strain ATCC 43226 / DSM 21942 / CIP 109018 / JCM 9157 / 1139) TaxID=1236973 RepID=W4QXQ7_HALA3|nr:(S)-benzoin forming benzil reductase [Halalkalibacter akibai]GAE36408.1 oxidoreductase [Halalkalibacter akibai JCM 9157]
MKYVVITGSSKGLGEAIVKQLLTEKEIAVCCIARSRNVELEELAKRHDVPLYFFAYDLENVDHIDELMKDVFSVIKDNVDSIHLINNAGMLNPINPIDKITSSEIISNLHVNLLSPMIITSEFMKHTTDFSCKKRIINISSGAGKRPIYGWSCYGTSKAGLDLFSQNTAVDQLQAKHPVQICSFGPGIMDTQMQEQIRSTDESNFVDVEKFRAYKNDGHLLPPSVVAKVVVDLLENESFPNGKVVSVQDYLTS